MARLTGFVGPQPGDPNFDNMSTIKQAYSPFQDKVVFRVTGYSFRKAEIDGKVDKDAFLNPVLETTIGDLFLSTILRGRITADGTVLIPSGTFNLFVKEQIAAHRTNGEILKAIVDGCENKDLIVRRTPYAGVTKDGRQYAAALVEIDFKEA